MEYIFIAFGKIYLALFKQKINRKLFANVLIRYVPEFSAKNYVYFPPWNKQKRGDMRNRVPIQISCCSNF